MRSTVHIHASVLALLACTLFALLITKATASPALRGPASASKTARTTSTIGSVPWRENFMRLPDGTTKDTGATSWTAHRGSGRFSILNGTLAVEGVGSVGVVKSSPIDISDGPVDVRLDLFSRGRLEIDEDYVQLYVTVDDDDQVLLGEVTGRQDDGTTITGKEITGSTLVVEIRTYVSYRKEYFHLDKLTVLSSKSMETMSPTMSPAPVSAPVSPPTQEIIAFTLVNAETNKRIGPFTDGMTIRLSKVGSNLNMQVAPDVPVVIGSVEFKYDGEVFNTENNAPYTLARNSGTNFFAWTPTPGKHTLTTTLWSDKRATGTIISSETLTFTVVE